MQSRIAGGELAGVGAITVMSGNTVPVSLQAEGEVKRSPRERPVSLPTERHAAWVVTGRLEREARLSAGIWRRIVRKSPGSRLECKDGRLGR